MPRIMHKTKDSYDTKVFLFINNSNIFFQVKYISQINQEPTFIFIQSVLFLSEYNWSIDYAWIRFK